MEIIERVDESGRVTRLYNHLFTREEFMAERDKLSELREQLDAARRARADHSTDVVLSRSAHEALKQPSDPARAREILETVEELKQKIKNLEKELLDLQPDKQALEESWRRHKLLIEQKAEITRRAREAKHAYDVQDEHFKIVQNTVNRTGLS